MTKYAIVENNKAVQVENSLYQEVSYKNSSGATVTESKPKYHSSLQEQFIEVPGSVQSGWSLEGSTWVELTQDEEDEEDEGVKEFLKDIRDQKRYGGLTINSIAIQTDAETQTALLGASIAAKEDSTYTVEWKTDNGFTTLDAVTIIFISTAVRNHVQKCFTIEKRVIDLLEAGTIDNIYDVEIKFEEFFNE